MGSKESASDPRSPIPFRQRAEHLLHSRRTDVSQMAPGDIQTLVHELEVREIELELQNEEFRHAQRELVESRDRYSELYEFAPVGYVTLDKNGTILEANLTAATMLGVERKNLLGKNITSHVASQSRDRCCRHLQSVFSGELKYTCEIEMRDSDGTLLEMRLESIAFGVGHDRGCRTAIIDVTDAWRTQRLLEQSEQRYRRLTEAVTDYVYRVQVEDGRAVEITHAANCEAVTGYSPEEFTVNPTLWVSMVPPGDRGAVEQQTASILSDQGASPLEHRIRRKDGQIRWVLNTVSLQYDDHGRLIAYDGLVRDITERKQAEQALRTLNEELEQRVDAQTADLRRRTDQLAAQYDELAAANNQLQASQQRLRLAHEAGGMGTCEWDLRANWCVCDETYHRLHGRRPDDKITRYEQWMNCVHRDDRHQLGDEIQQAIREHRPLAIEYRVTWPDGTVHWLASRGEVMLDDYGEPARVIGAAFDITERKDAEESLRREHDFSKSLVNTARTIVLVLDTEGRIVQFNPYLEELTGWRLEEVQGKDWFERFLPERDRQGIRKLFARAVHGERTRGNTNPILTKDGREKHIEWFDAPLSRADGQIIGLLCTGQDITDRKRAERKLREREERLRAILNTAAEAIITIDERGIINSVNPATEQMFGYTEAELVGQNVKILMPPPYCDEHDKYIAHYLQTGQARIIGTGREVAARRKDGSIFPIGLAVSEVEHLNLFTGIIRDISAVKELQREVLEIAADEDRRIGQELHDSTQQQLTGLGLVAQSLAEALAQELTQRAGMASRLAVGIKETANHLHLLSRGLVPVEVEAEGLRASLTELASRIREQYRVSCNFRCEGAVDVADNFLATHLYRIAQEAVNNAIKHGRTELIEIWLSGAGKTLTLKVLDDGVGIRDKRDFDPGMGLRIMQYRAGLMDGTVQIGPGERGGTLVACTVPRGRAHLRRQQAANRTHGAFTE